MITSRLGRNVEVSDMKPSEAEEIDSYSGLDWAYIKE
jgi:hypothetical protein